MMTFSAIVFVIVLSLAMHLFNIVTVTSENLSLYSNQTLYYDNIELIKDDSILDEEIKNGLVRIVSTKTIIPTLY